MAKETICNQCGRVFDIWDTQANFSIRGQLGYGTKYDGERLELDLCCDCMERLIGTCVIPPVSGGVVHGGTAGGGDSYPEVLQS
jgi:hypothetical protein